MKEIEIKARLRNKAAIIEKLKSLGCVFEKQATHEDTVYAEHVGSLTAFRTNKVFLRLRVKNGSKILFTLKKRMANDLDAIEHEVEVSSKDEMEKSLLLMGYREAARVNKARETTRYNGCEICVDEVENLGSFIEMEKLSEDGDSVKIQEELFRFFLSLGVLLEDRAFSGYDILMMEQKEKEKPI
ncbi:MAG: class IV adenylate cyclase [bacterium]|nr:class IV adenylate cyclase [bacterium]